MRVLPKTPHHLQSRYLTNYKQYAGSRLTLVQYAYPISQLQQAVTNILDAVDRPNTLWPYHILSGPLNRTIVGPNADTLYLGGYRLIIWRPRLDCFQSQRWKKLDMAALRHACKFHGRTTFYERDWLVPAMATICWDDKQCDLTAGGLFDQTGGKCFCSTRKWIFYFD